LRVDNTWATQDTLLTAIAELVVPDLVVREGGLADGLSSAAFSVGVTSDGATPGFAVNAPFPLSQVRNDDIDKAAEAAYRRDYMMFGFSRWVG
jgi:hypothetical protein